MSDQQNIAAFYKEVFAAAFPVSSESSKVVAKVTEVEATGKKNVESQVKPQQLMTEDYLPITNYPSPNYQGHRRSAFPIFASVSTFCEVMR